LISQGFGRGRIAPAQDEKILNEELRLFISVDEMNAGAVLLPRDPDGKQLTRGGTGQGAEGQARCLRRQRCGAGIRF
jgi:hypothetical protein